MRPETERECVFFRTRPTFWWRSRRTQRGVSEPDEQIRFGVCGIKCWLASRQKLFGFHTLLFLFWHPPPGPDTMSIVLPPGMCLRISHRHRSAEKRKKSRIVPRLLQGAVIPPSMSLSAEPSFDAPLSNRCLVAGRILLYDGRQPPIVHHFSHVVTNFTTFTLPTRALKPLL